MLILTGSDLTDESFVLFIRRSFNAGGHFIALLLKILWFFSINNVTHCD